MIPQKGQKAKKSLGQNFLTDQPAISAVVECLRVKYDDIIVEIGPGHGELTQELLKKKPAKLIAIEKDRELAIGLKELVDRSKGVLEIVEGDALKVLPALSVKGQGLGVTSWKLVGNIPYYITGFLLRTIGELENKPEVIVLTIQKEVAERIAAKPPAMNLLSASVQVWGKPEIMGLIDRESFDPVPNVDSAIIRIVPVKGQGLSVKDEKNFYKTIKILFRQPRKTILNNLKDAVKNEELDEATLSKIIKNQPVDLSLRAQNLSIENIKTLAVYLK